MAQLKDSIVSGNLRVTDTILADILQADSIKGGIVAAGTTWNGNTIDEIYGGTGQNTYAKGDLLYASAANTLSKLGANTGTKQFLSMTSSVPSWASIAFTDIPALYIGTTKVQSSSVAQALTGITTGAFSSNVTIGGTLSVTSTATVGSTLTVNSAGSKFKGAAANILELYRTDTTGGAFIDYYYAGQTSNWWRVGPIKEGQFAFIWKTNTYVAYLDANRNLYPATNTDSTTTQSLGTSSYRWNDLYTRRINASSLSTLSGGITLGGTYNSADSKLVWDSDHSAWHLIGNFYADGFVSSGGLSTGSGTSGIDWSALATNDSSHKIHVSHMPYVAGSASDLTTGTSTTGTIWAAKTIADYVQSQVNTSVTSALYFRGESSTAITNGGTETATIDGSSLTAKTGDLVLYDGKEFAWDGTKWIQLGDESSWASKTTKIEGTGYLSGGGTLESNRTIDIGTTYKTRIDNGNTAYGYFSNNILPISHGGTGKNTWTQYGIVYASASGTLAQIALPTWAASTTYWLKATTNSSKVPTYSLAILSKSDVGLDNVANSTYAGGTAVTLNGTSKASSTASFYAPTASGTVSEVLLSGGASTSPTWVKQSNLSTGFHPKALISKGTTATTTAGETYGVAGDSTSGKRIFTKWFVNLDSGDTTLVDGMIISFRIPLAGLSTVGECITIDGNEQHFHQVVYNTASILTNHFPVNTIITVQYDASISSASYGKYDEATGKYVHNGNTTTAIKGVWRVLSLYDSGNTDVRYEQTIYYPYRTVAAGGAICRYTFCMMTQDGKLTSLTTTNNNQGTAKTMFSGYLDPRKVYFWNHTDTYAAGATITRSNVLLTHEGSLIDYRYTFNCGTTLTAHSNFYIVGTIDNNGFKLDPTTPWSCTLPTTEDNKVYIFVGMAHTDTAGYRGTLEENNTIYWYKDGAVRVYNYYSVKAETATKLSTVSKTAWGQTYWTDGGIPATISGNMSNVGSISMSGSISGATTGSFSSNVTVGGTLTVGTSSANKATTLNGTLSVTGLSTLAGGAKLTTTKKIWFGDDYYLELDTNGLHTNAGFYSDSFVSAGGLSDGSGTSGIDLDAMWQSLKNTSDTHGADKIAVGHIPDLSGTYQTKYGFTITGTSGASYNLANFVTSSGVTSVATGTGLTGGTITSTGTISINSTYQTYISHGESAYNSLGNYLPLSGGTIASDNFGVFHIQRNHTTNAAAIGFKHYSSGTTVEQLGYIGMNTKNGSLMRWNYNNTTVYTILDSENSSVSLSGSTLTVKINGVSKSLTNTTYSSQAAASGGTAVSLVTTGEKYNWNTAYGWGNHASAGYLLTSTAASTYLPLAGGTMTGVISRKMAADTSNYENAIRWVNTSGTTIAQIGFLNVSNEIYLNPLGSSSVYNDVVGNYSLVISSRGLTYNTYSIWHSGNSNLNTVNWTCNKLYAGNTSNTDWVGNFTSANAWVGINNGSGYGIYANSTYNDDIKYLIYLAANASAPGTTGTRRFAVCTNGVTYIDGATSIDSTLNVTGAATFSGTVTCNSSLTVSANAGIGTNSPYSLLEVAGTLSAPGTENLGSTAMLALNVHNDDGLFFGFASRTQISAATNAGWIQSAYHGTTSTPAAEHTYALLLNPLGGNVGIGTTSPSYTLDVNGYIGCSTLMASGDVSVSRILYFNTGGAHIARTTAITGNGVTGEIGVFCYDGSNFQKFRIWCSTTEVYGNIFNNGEVISNSNNTFRIIAGNYGSFWRNDGSYTYLLMTASGDQYGSFNSLRPFCVNNSTGAVTMGHAVSILSTLSVTNTATIASASGNWTYLRLSNGSINWDVASGNHTQGMLGVANTFEIRDNGAGQGIAIRSGTSSYGKLVVAVTSGESSIGYYSKNNNAVSGYPIWTAGYTADSSNNFGWYYKGSYEGWKLLLSPAGNLAAVGTVAAGVASDKRLKTNIQTLSTDSAKDIILKARPVNFTWKGIATELYDGYKGDDIGLIAQEVEDLLPQAIGTIYEKYKRLDYTKFIPPIITVIQDHEKRIKELEDIIAKLTEENKHLKEQI